MIITPEHPREYAIICNEVANRKDLSARAKGIYYKLVTYPANWKLYQKELNSYFTEGRDALRKAFQELVDKGYIGREPVIDKDGKFAGQDYKVYWNSQNNADFPYSGKTVTRESRQAKNPKLLNTKREKLNKNKINKFIPPSLQEIEDYAREKQTHNPENAAQVFFDYFTADEEHPWIDSQGKQVKSWKQKFLTWKNHGNFNKLADLSQDLLDQEMEAAR